ncbi:hypothetical protein ACLHDF_17115 [Priestia aryabhattai]
MINYVLFLPTLWDQHALLAIASYACLVLISYSRAVLSVPIRMVFHPNSGEKES